MAHPLREAAPERRAGERRPMPRIDILLESAIFLETVPLVDVGRLGFSVRTAIAHPPGTKLTLHIPNFGAIEAHAVWHSNNRLGARFVAPLDDEVLVSLSGAS